MRTISDILEMQAVAEDLGKAQILGLVPTMGYLHEGHLALVRQARHLGDMVIVSIFVNPTQFGPSEDLDRYPRNLERDMSLLEKEKTDILFYPEARDMYPHRYSTYIEVRNLDRYLCGTMRTGHFVGVATVVAKLFNIVKPNFAVFGQKDYQQLAIIERMVRDLNMAVKIVPHPTVREPDGLAMSSRNTYLSTEEREKALNIYRALQRAEALFGAGVRDGEMLRGEAKAILLAAKDVEIEYVSVCDTETLEELATVSDRALLAIACRVGKTRLIDNTLLSEAH
jgi:pantoate--beta-alanine ligase